METNLSEWVNTLRAATTGLLDVDLTAGSDDEFKEGWVELERCIRQLTTAVTTRVLVEVSERGLPDRPGVNALQKYAKKMLRLSGSEAWGRVKDASAFGLWRRGMSEETRTSSHPHVTNAQRNGAVGVEHSRSLRDAFRKIPHAVDERQKEAAEEILTETASTAAPEEVTTAAQRLMGHLDPDGKLTDDHDRARQRGLRLTRQGTDLMSTLTGNLDPATRAMLDVILSKWAAPGFNNPEDELSPQGALNNPDVDPTLLAECAGRDHRSQEQRNHDAVKALLAWVLAAGNLGEKNGLPMHVIVTMTLRELETESGVATTATGGLIPVKDALELAQRKRLYLCLFNHIGRPLHFGHARRTANLDQRLALFAAERGCTRPGCGVPAMGTQAHHRNRDYLHGGLTDIDDLGLVCEGDHPVIDENNGVDEPEGWYTRTGAEGTENAGRTEWVPPASEDPTRTPRVNNRHDSARLLAAAMTRVLARREAEWEAWERFIDRQAERRSRTHTHTTTDDDGDGDVPDDS